MKPNASVRTSDLEEALDYLEGLMVILRRLDDEERGRFGDDELLAQLDQLRSFGMPWQPLRYQSGGGGTGWEFVAANVDDLRARLMERHKDAASSVPTGGRGTARQARRPGVRWRASP